MYRALALKAIEWAWSFDDEPALRKLAERARIALEPNHWGQTACCSTQDVSARIGSRRDRGRFARLRPSGSARVDGRASTGEGQGRWNRHGRRDIGTRCSPMLT